MNVKILRKSGVTYEGRAVAFGEMLEVVDDIGFAWCASGIAERPVRAAAVEHEARTPVKPAKARRAAK